MSDQQLITSLNNHVLSIRLNNPKTLNSLTKQIREGLYEAVTRAINDEHVRAIYLTGNGRSFSAGGDLESIEKFNDPWSTHNRFRQLIQWITPFVRLQKPVIVGLNGMAVGGGMGLALSGDILIAAESAEFRCGFTRIGAIPDFGMMYHLPRLVGMARAKEFVFRNGIWSAMQAQELGIVSEVVADTELDNKAYDRACELAAGPVEAMGLAKWLMGRSFETSIEDMMAFESLAQPLAFQTNAHKEGFGALREKREVDFPSASARETWYKSRLETNETED
ncbi:MAG: hypothetical protein CBB68_11365 [Rhodospirillaceae bacterium TMED8]|nr:enoyl-CoA hydratase [Magnetovibrio sp.]OUT49662.1 MAG: hypothetical protein CBB68_11365 [Rhodospirillaceae bacterium TMED8]